MGKPCINLSAKPNPKSYFLGDETLARYVKVADQYDLSADLLKDSRALLLNLAQDQYLLLRHKTLLEDYIKDGGTIVFQGQVALPFLGCLRPYIPAENMKYAEFDITIEQPHPIPDAIEPDCLNLRNGVRGFYAHGSNPAPADAVIISTIRNASLAVDWQWHSGKGRLFVHSGNDFGLTYADDAKNIALLHRVVSWAIGEDISND